VCIDHHRRRQALFRTTRALLYDSGIVTSPFVNAIELARRSRDMPDPCRLHYVDTLRSRALEQERVEPIAADRSAVWMPTIEAGRHFSHDGPIASHPRDLANRGTSKLADPRTQAEFVQELQAGWA
jgi:hypothetical protein